MRSSFACHKSSEIKYRYLYRSNSAYTFARYNAANNVILIYFIHSLKLRFALYETHFESLKKDLEKVKLVALFLLYARLCSFGEIKLGYTLDVIKFEATFYMGLLKKT